jgi:hypothetical protein
MLNMPFYRRLDETKTSIMPEVVTPTLKYVVRDTTSNPRSTYMRMSLVHVTPRIMETLIEVISN